MGIKVGCKQCRQPLEEWEAGLCEGCGSMRQRICKRCNYKSDTEDGVCPKCREGFMADGSEKHLGRIPTDDAVSFLADAKTHGFDGMYRSVVDVENYRHSHIWQVKFQALGAAFFLGWRCGRIAGKSV